MTTYEIKGHCAKCRYGYITEEHTCKTEEEMYREAFPFDLPYHEEEWKERGCVKYKCNEPAFYSDHFENNYCLKHRIENFEVKEQIKKLEKFKKSKGLVKINFECFFCHRFVEKFITKNALAYFKKSKRPYCTCSCYSRASHKNRKLRKAGLVGLW